MNRDDKVELLTRLTQNHNMSEAKHLPFIYWLLSLTFPKPESVSLDGMLRLVCRELLCIGEPLG